jgi:hypothetical protein
MPRPIFCSRMAPLSPCQPRRLEAEEWRGFKQMIAVDGTIIKLAWSADVVSLALRRGLANITLN